AAIESFLNSFNPALTPGTSDAVSVPTPSIEGPALPVDALSHSTGVPLLSVTNTWTGGNGDWSTSSNWSQGHTPVSGEDVQITNGATVSHSNNSTASGDAINSLLIGGGSTLVLSGGSLAVSTTLDASTGSSHFTLAGGTLIGGTVTAGTTITATTNGGVLNG